MKGKECWPCHSSSLFPQNRHFPKDDARGQRLSYTLGGLMNNLGTSTQVRYAGVPSTSQ